MHIDYFGWSLRQHTFVIFLDDGIEGDFLEDTSRIRKKLGEPAGLGIGLLDELTTSAEKAANFFPTHTFAKRHFGIL